MADDRDGTSQVAIACQGGGSHTAFTAGVLKRLVGAQELAGMEIVGLSGTSGGAVCALLAWSALLDDDPPAAGVRLEAFWADNSASTPLEQLVNAWVLWAARLENLVVLPAVSPYDTPTSVQALSEFRAMLERRVDFDQLAVKTVQAGASGPMLLLGAVDVLSGDFRAFNSHREPITVGPGPGLGRHPQPVPRCAGRWRHLLGRPVLRTRLSGTWSTPDRTSCG